MCYGSKVSSTIAIDIEPVPISFCVVLRLTEHETSRAPNVPLFSVHIGAAMWHNFRQINILEFVMERCRCKFS